MDKMTDMSGVHPVAALAGLEIQQMIASGAPGVSDTEVLKYADTEDQQVRLVRMIADNKPGWTRKLVLSDGAMFEDRKRRRVIVSVGRYPDNKLWIHASISHARETKIPHYDELCLLKRLWIGEDEKAIMVFPDKEHHVNIRNNVLHVYSCLNDNPLPEFSALGTI